MSFITDTIQCANCKRYMNVAFGVVGTEVIAQWPEECGFCKHKQKFERVRSGWWAEGDGTLKAEPI